MSSNPEKTPQNEELVVYLHIQEGINLQLAEYVWIVAKLSENSLHSEVIKTGHSTPFEWKLFWVTDKKSVKRLKLENEPLKIECYRLKDYKGGNPNDAPKEQIGYVLLSMRTIPIYSLIQAVQAKPRWFKLIGLNKEWRPHKSELHLTCMITSKEFTEIDRNTFLETHSVEEMDSIVIEESPRPCMLQSHEGLFIRLLQEEGLLQVGNIDTECHLFVVSIYIINLKHLDTLVSSTHDDKEFYINYMLLGNPHMRPVQSKFNHIHQVQEKISINFRSSLKSIKEYFDKIFYIPIEVFHGTRKVASVEVRLGGHIVTTDLADFIQRFPKRYEFEGTIDLKLPSSMEVDKEKVPYMEYKITIAYKGTQQLHQKEFAEKKVVPDPLGGGDFVRLNETYDQGQFKVVGVEPKSPKKSLSEVVDKDPPKSPKKSIPEVINPSAPSEKSAELTPRLFSYNVRIKSLKFNRKPTRGIYQISFYHQNADSPRTFLNRDIKDNNCVDGDNLINFEDLELKIYFTSFADGIMEVIRSSSVCTLCIKGPHNIHAKAHLDCTTLQEKLSGNVLMTSQNESTSALAEIHVTLEDLGPNFNAKMIENDSQTASSVNEQRNLFDEDIAYKMIKELEDWKMKEQQAFLIDLKKTEKDYLDKIKIAWHEKKSRFENELKEKSNKLQELSKSLQDAQKNAAKCELSSEEEIIKYKADLEHAFKEQLLILKEKSKDLQDELMRELRLKDIQNCELQEQIKKLENENRALMKTLDEKETKNSVLKYKTVSKEEHDRVLREMSLLRDDYEKSLKEKVKYKEQWAKAFRECNQLRRHQTSDARECNMHNRYERVCEMLTDEECIMNFDQQEIDELKQKLLFD